VSYSFLRTIPVPHFQRGLTAFFKLKGLVFRPVIEVGTWEFAVAAAANIKQNKFIRHRILKASNSRSKGDLVGRSFHGCRERTSQRSVLNQPSGEIASAC
jgi:hypothetical protein